MVKGNTKGCIICTASIAAGIGSDRHTDYVMSKNAVLALMRCASTQLGSHGIRVNCVSPGPVATPLLCQGVGVGVEEAVLFLASEESQFITGHNLVVDGGFGRDVPK
ncbi:Glucose/ribitol dehydrogenase [Corchorus olitorius]|uniref:Glucose/ribitol dehydrogenase n=1 Tax=Corchorus olitorius TaxID=93759 RepID=A0A1R3KCU0_9ROSI|nr:Glucose/ribitol dehydrogenase [Corchorus olitorius]